MSSRIVPIRARATRSTTPNYGLTLPIVQGDRNVWGGMLNENFVILDGALDGVSDRLAVVEAAPPSGVPASRQIIAGAGLGGGGSLAADVTLTANVVTVQGRTGDVVLTAQDISGAGGVPATRLVNAGPGMSGGGPLSADVTLSANVRTVNGRTGDVVISTADTGGVPVTRQVIAGAGLTGGGSLASDVTLAVSLTPQQIGAAQTPWLQNIDGANFQLSNVSQLGVGFVGAPTYPLHVSGKAYVSGSVGIGAAPPDPASDSILTVARSDGKKAAIDLFNGAASLERGSYALYRNSAQNWACGLGLAGGSDGNFSLQNNTAGTRPLTIDSVNGRPTFAGNVNGGTAFLDVINQNATETVGHGAGIRFGPSSFFLNNPDRAPSIRGVVDNISGLSSSGLYFGTYLNGLAYTRMVITGAGNVGIGTDFTGPAAKLHISYDSGYAIRFNLFGTREYGIAIQSSDGAFLLDDVTAGQRRMTIPPAGGLSIPSLPSVNPPSGTQQFWYDPADGYRVKYQP